MPGTERWPFSVARIRLAYGQHLRHARSVKDARFQLVAALDTFRRLGADPWAARVAEELRANGHATSRAHQEPTANLLTPQENEIATLAASGMTNKQIGERLFLSHRTVAGHLYRLYPKLGVTSRVTLADALAALPGANDSNVESHEHTTAVSATPNAAPDDTGGHRRPTGHADRDVPSDLRAGRRI